MDESVVNILILRDVIPTHRTEFEDVVRRWIPEAVRFPGHQGVFMLTPPRGSHQYGALLRFDSQEAWEEFSRWDSYRIFLDELRPHLASEPRTELMHGLEAWFPAVHTLGPPRWKMAVLTYGGVCAMVWPSSQAAGFALAGAPFLVKYFIVNALVVAGLTWVVMPRLVRLASDWLHHRRGGA